LKHCPLRRLQSDGNELNWIELATLQFSSVQFISAALYANAPSGYVYLWRWSEPVFRAHQWQRSDTYKTLISYHVRLSQ